MDLGDRVTFQYGTVEAQGTIVEDRGNIGVDGRKLFTVLANFADFQDHPSGQEPIAFRIELPEEELKPVP